MNGNNRWLLPGVIAFTLLFLLTGCFGSSSKSVSRTGSLTVLSDPEELEADIFLNGKPQHQQTPYTFTGLTPGTYTVGLSLGGYEYKEETAVVQRGQTNTIKIKMSPQEGEPVKGYITSGSGGPPVAGTRVTAWSVDEETVIASTRTRDDGSFLLYLPPGRYDLIADQPGTTTWAVGKRQNVMVPSTEPIEIMQYRLFADSASADPQVLSIAVTGLQPGAVVSEPTDVHIEVTGSNSNLIRQIAVRIGHGDWRTDDLNPNQGFWQMLLHPSLAGPGETFLHIRAYDIQLNGAELVIPFTVPASAGNPGIPDAPQGLELAAFTFEYSSPMILGAEAMSVLSDYVADGIGITSLPTTSRWVRIMWDRDPDAAGYKVYRRSASHQEATLVSDWAATRPREMVEGRERYVLFDTSAVLQTGESYYYTVRAYNEAGQLGPASDEVEVFTLEPFEARLTQPSHHAQVSAQPAPVFRWEGTVLPEKPGYSYDYIYRFSIATETSTGLYDPNYAYMEDRLNLEAATYPHLLPGASYQWDVIVAFAMVHISSVSQAFSVSGKIPPNDLLPPADGDLAPLGGSTNGAFRFEVR